MAEKKRPAFKDKCFNLEEQTFRRWAYRAPHGVEFQDTLHPKYWASVAQRMTKDDVISIVAEDGSYRGELVVMAVEAFAMQVGVLWFKDLTTIDTVAVAADADKDESKYVIEFDAKSKWRVVYSADGRVVIDGKASKKAAEAALREYLSDLAA